MILSFKSDAHLLCSILGNDVPGLSRLKVLDLYLIPPHCPSTAVSNLSPSLTDLTFSISLQFFSMSTNILRQAAILSYWDDHNNLLISWVKMNIPLPTRLFSLQREQCFTNINLALPLLYFKGFFSLLALLWPSKPNVVCPWLCLQ